VDDPAVYEARVQELAAAIRSEPAASRPAPGGGIVPPSGYRAERPREGRLVITAGEVRFSAAGQEAVHRPGGLDARGAAVLGEAERGRARPGQAPLRATAAGLAAGLVAAGTVLGRCFLDGPAGQALARETAAAAGGGSLRLAVEVPDPRLAGLPWETLVLPRHDTPLVLQDRVQMYRAVTPAHPPAAIGVRGPLRILAVIASPDADGGELLDYEAELAAIIQAVEPARRDQGAYVQVLNWGSTAAIRDALLGHAGASAGAVASRSMQSAHGPSSMPRLRSMAQITTSVQAVRLPMRTLTPPLLPDPVALPNRPCLRSKSTMQGTASSNGPRSTGSVMDCTDGPGQVIASLCGSLSSTRNSNRLARPSGVGMTRAAPRKVPSPDSMAGSLPITSVIVWPRARPNTARQPHTSTTADIPATQLARSCCSAV
jgi:hypothetical protein